MTRLREFGLGQRLTPRECKRYSRTRITTAQARVPQSQSMLQSSDRVANHAIFIQVVHEVFTVQALRCHAAASPSAMASAQIVFKCKVSTPVSVSVYLLEIKWPTARIEQTIM